MGFSAGDHVWADFGEGKVLAHVLSGPKVQDNGETKFWIQNPENGRGELLGHRDPKDDDEHGTGRTFWATT